MSATISVVLTYLDNVVSQAESLKLLCARVLPVWPYVVFLTIMLAITLTNTHRHHLTSVWHAVRDRGIYVVALLAQFVVYCILVYQYHTYYPNATVDALLSPLSSFHTSLAVLRDLALTAFLPASPLVLAHVFWRMWPVLHLAPATSLPVLHPIHCWAAQDDAEFATAYHQTAWTREAHVNRMGDEDRKIDVDLVCRQCDQITTHIRIATFTQTVDRYNMDRIEEPDVSPADHGLNLVPVPAPRTKHGYMMDDHCYEDSPYYQDYEDRPPTPDEWVPPKPKCQSVYTLNILRCAHCNIINLQQTVSRAWENYQPRRVIEPGPSYLRHPYPLDRERVTCVDGQAALPIIHSANAPFDALATDIPDMEKVLIRCTCDAHIQTRRQPQQRLMHIISTWTRIWARCVRNTTSEHIQVLRCCKCQAININYKRNNAYWPHT